MRLFAIFIALSVTLVLCALVYIRFAPTDPARWHQTREVRETGDQSTLASFRAVRRITEPAEDVLAAVKTVALQTDRTRLIAGDVDEGVMTFVTRSRFWGFPDYTTVYIQGDLIIVFGRLRFGNFDHDVNKARVQSWLAALGPLTEPL